MNPMNKHSLLSVLFLILFTITSCNEILEEDPVSQVTAATHYVDQDGLEDGLKAAYTPLRWFYGMEGGMYFTIAATDIWTAASDGNRGQPALNRYTPNFNSTVAFIDGVWSTFYILINQCNTIVDRAADIQSIDEEEKNRIVGEARFLRALAYFHLVQQFGDVHFTLEETIGAETEAFRTPINTIYEQGIIPDLEFAITNLPFTTQDYGRATKGVAEALMARVRLVRENWSEAQLKAESVINNYSYELVKPYAALWDIDNDVNSEIIWSVQYTDDPLTNGTGNRTHLYFVYHYERNSAMMRDTENGRPWARFMPTNFFYNLWDPSIDSRYHGSFKTVWIANKPGEINGNIVSPGDTSIRIVLYPVEDSLQEKAPYWYIDYHNEEVTTQENPMEIGGLGRGNYPVLSKFLDPLRANFNDPSGQRDFPVIRLAEMYLIAAEAAYMQGNAELAAQYINVLRTRAAVEGKETDMQVSAEDMDIDFFLDERAKELAGEMHRWYDLKRTGKLLERVRLYNLDAAPNIQEKHLVRPIPQNQIDRVSNPGDFPQNPGY